MLKVKVRLAAILFSVALAFDVHAEAKEEHFSVPRADGSPVELLVNRPASTKRMPVLLAIDGSLCIPSKTSDYMARLSPDVTGLGPYVLLVVEKPEPTVPAKDSDGSYSIGPDFRCSETFKKYYTLERRVLDHLRALQLLRKHADWWDGRLFVWGFSDGAHVATRVGAFSSETQGMVLGGLGGGTSMAHELEGLMCSKDKAPEKCRDAVKAQVDEIRANPTSAKTWMGDANTYAAWASRLDAVEANFLKDVQFPVLVFHGSKDNSVPVASARVLATQFAGPDGLITYREIEGMGHGIGSNLAPERGAQLQQEFLAWLLPASRN